VNSAIAGPRAGSQAGRELVDDLAHDRLLDVDQRVTWLVVGFRPAPVALLGADLVELPVDHSGRPSQTVRAWPVNYRARSGILLPGQRGEQVDERLLLEVPGPAPLLWGCDLCKWDVLRIRAG
jgi:hypothetical protein